MPKMAGKSICCFSAVFSLRPVTNRFIFLFSLSVHALSLQSGLMVSLCGS